jgi:hypothetical protein
VQQQEPEPVQQQDEEEGPDTRVACGKCERKFNADRVDKHTAVCKGTKTAAAVAAVAEPATNEPAEEENEAAEARNDVPKWKQDRAALKERMRRDINCKLAPTAAAVDAGAV